MINKLSGGNPNKTYQPINKIQNGNPIFAPFLKTMDLTFQIPINLLIFWLLLAFALATIVQLVYFWGIFSGLAFFKTKKQSDSFPPVSVVITANNQYNDLQKSLPSFLSQDYPDFEVVVVNDNSDDGSHELLKDFSRKYANLKVVELKQRLNWFSGRKFPLSLGIKSATYDLILLTDPGCIPESNGWIKAMGASFTSGSEIVLGYSTYNTASKINKWLRFAAFYDALLYLSMALRGFPYKGIGKNMGYSRALFYRNKGFSSHYVISAGDDELFVNRAAKKHNTKVEVGEESIIKKVKKTSFSDWLTHEKTRLKIRRFFKFRDRLLIRLFSFTSFAFYGLFGFLIFFKAPLFLLLLIFSLRFISMMLIFAFAQKRLSEKNLILLSPIFEIFLILIDLFIWILLFFNRKKKWS